MRKKLLDEELLEDSQIFLHPLRYRLLELVLAEQPMHVEGISRALDVKGGLVAYHLMALQERGFVKSKYEHLFMLEQRGTAIKVYTVTDKVADVKAELKKGLEQEL
jgi:predicted ArsR family transcriptional regulator